MLGGDDQNLHALISLVGDLVNDQKVLDLAKSIETLQKKLMDNKELQMFNKQKHFLVIEIVHGNKWLKGKCDICP